MDRRATIRQDIWNLPNVLTMARIAVIPVVCSLTATNDPVHAVIATILFGLAGFTDWLDGYIARRQGLVSMTGKFLDPLADKLLVMAVLVTLLPLDRVPAWFVVLTVGRELAINGLRALAAGEGIVIASDWGGKWKTGFQFVGLACLLLHHRFTIDYGPFALDVRMHAVGLPLLYCSLAYSLWSGWEYLRGFLDGVADAKAGRDPA
ncbi:MAG: CDP-diacylglycerol--glycerol-3-phosphate 3-phosphatidyltransferase [Myxococcales bacterium]|nr:CDP-diacylglycerol--glycerol-3-phosphate 3-phosphatidyltransferase [Myxococcales bacterium]MCB9519996.1 CDP-diacylglycerol--glycerol-3-phosphate 3-phosphatidyltransferase [Myxococcales bacterium]MCB9534355.1 CDP-diacylglycerol--glycerol-3-phosphate 3-phosphatidyltransferase [Myxococcales bacterium]